MSAQKVAQELGFPFTHPVGRGAVQEIYLDCWRGVTGRRCDIGVYYPDDWYLRIITHPDVGPGWQESDVANDQRGITQLVTVQGQLGVGYGQNTTGDEMDPNGWPGKVAWIDPEKDTGFVLLGPYDLETLLSIANGPWCTLATPAGVEPQVPFC